MFDGVARAPRPEATHEQKAFNDATDIVRRSEEDAPYALAVNDRAYREASKVRQQRLGGGCADQAEDGDECDQRREEREDLVVGERAAQSVTLSSRNSRNVRLRTPPG
jgi:hypothetical protein